MNLIKVKNEEIEKVLGWDKSEIEGVKEVVIGEVDGEESGVVGIVNENGKLEVVGLRMDREVENMEEMYKYIEMGF